METGSIKSQSPFFYRISYFLHKQENKSKIEQIYVAFQPKKRASTNQ